MKLWVIALVLFGGMPEIQARPIPESEGIAQLLDGRELTSLLDIERAGLNNGSTDLDLWSGSYWPHYQGALAARYRDPLVSKLIAKEAKWDKFKDLAEKSPLYATSRLSLSPAEKYDLLVGDRHMSLTKYSWKIGEKANTFGSVPKWRGICDGWASASQKMPRPVKSVKLLDARGEELTFFPEDIKALGSLLYARAQENVIFLGKRCRSRLVSIATGACDETNPATFHRALVNRVGRMKKTFIADVSPGKEVWNYPIKNYEVSYFNVFDDETESKKFTDVAELFVKKNRFSKSGKRHKRTDYIVGVKLTVRYADMRPAHKESTDGTLQDKTMEKTYFYDLELDRNFNILGGESLSGNLPDFIWAPNDKTYPLTDAEQRETPRNSSMIARMAKDASEKGQPLSIIVEKLFESAK